MVGMLLAGVLYCYWPKARGSRFQGVTSGRYKRVLENHMAKRWEMQTKLGLHGA